MVPPIAHFGHWYVSLPVFMGPVVALFGYIYIGEWRNKRRERKYAPRAGAKARRTADKAHRDGFSAWPDEPSREGAIA